MLPLSREKLLLGYQQLPKNYLMELSSASEEKLEILKGRLSKPLEAGESHTLYVEGTAQPIYTIFLEKFSIQDMWGINFSEYFSAHFEQDNTYKVVNKPVVFIYNVGLERAVNTSFSSKMLRSLLKDLTQAGCWVIIESHLPYQKFQMQYEIEIINKILIPLKKSSSFL